MPKPNPPLEELLIDAEADDEVVGKSWFNVAAYPKASFVLKSLKAMVKVELILEQLVVAKAILHLL